MPVFIPLFLVGFARTLFIILIIYYGIKLFTKYVLPYLLQKGMKNMEKKMNQQYQPQQKPSGEVTVEKGTTKGKKDDGVDGEYVDFEEVD